MIQKDYTFKRMIMRGILTLFFSSLMAFAYAQDPCPDAPLFDTQQYFCSESAWAQIGEDADFLGDLLIHAEQDFTLTWYRDANLTDEVTDPNTEPLIDGDVFYVTQTNSNGCESDALRIIASETDCGCLKDPLFEDQEGNPSARGYEFYRFDGIDNHKTCGQSMFGANQVNLGVLDGYTWQDNVALVTKGFDLPHLNFNGDPNGAELTNLTRTNPNNPNSEIALRLNRGAEYGDSEGTENISSMSKKFIAGEVFAFNFSLIIQHPDHDYEEQPFAQVNLYDKDENLIQTRCIVADLEDCVFNIVKFSDSMVFYDDPVLYSDWSCMKFNTSDYLGEPLRVEFITAYCSQRKHFSYMYIDDLYAGDDSDDLCSNATFGYALINSVSPQDEYCYIIPESDTATCTTEGNGNIPGFPVYVCGEYAAPVSQGPPATINDLSLNILQNDVVIGQIKKAEPGTSPNTFCFLIEEADLDVLPYGQFTFEVKADFAMNCGNEYHFYIDDRSRYEFCPSAGCPDELQACDMTGNGTAEFDLTDHGNIFFGTQWSGNDVVITYYEEETDALDKTNAIPNPEEFENTQAYNQMIYMRLDWDVPGVSSDCFYLMPLDLNVMHTPLLMDWEDDVIFCDDEEINYPLVGTPTNIEDLINVSYTWYKDGVQLPHAGSIYYATQTGEYKVVVKEDQCASEETRTIVIKRVELDVTMEEQSVELCDADSYTIRPSINSVGESEVDMDDVTYLWNTGATTKDLTVTESGLYTLEVTIGDCIYQESMEILMSMRPEINSIDTVTLCRDTQETVVLNISHPDLEGLHIQWFRDGGLIAENVTELEVSAAGIYKVVAGDALATDCFEEITFTVEYYNNENCIIPEGLSPNNDGLNDNLDLEYLNDQSGIASLKIYNRYGVEVYSKDNYTNEWFGQSKNDKVLPVGVYYYVIELKDGSDTLTGTIYLNY